MEEKIETIPAQIKRLWIKDSIRDSLSAELNELWVFYQVGTGSQIDPYTQAAVIQELPTALYKLLQSLRNYGTRPLYKQAEIIQELTSALQNELQTSRNYPLSCINND